MGLKKNFFRYEEINVIYVNVFMIIIFFQQSFDLCKMSSGKTIPNVN